MNRKAAFFASSKDKIDLVFNDQMMAALRDLVDLCPIRIDRSKLKENEQALKEVEIGFATWGMAKFTEEEIERFLPNLNILFYAAGSVRSFARPFLNQQVKVVSAWAANAVPVAEYTVANIILANKGFLRSAAKTKNDRHGAGQCVNGYPGNYGTTVGLIGAGMIGKKVIELLQPYNMNILVFDPFLPDELAGQIKVTKCGLEELFSRCQTISNHLANNPETVGMLNGRLFQRMSKNATFINTGRGAQVVEKDLIEALKAEPDRTAILDVTDPEPPLENSELLKMDNVILTPHMAGSQSREVVRLARYMIEELEGYLDNRPLRYEVDMKMLETMA